MCYDPAAVRERVACGAEQLADRAPRPLIHGALRHARRRRCEMTSYESHRNKRGRFTKGNPGRKPGSKNKPKSLPTDAYNVARQLGGRGGLAAYLAAPENRALRNRLLLESAPVRPKAEDSDSTNASVNVTNVITVVGIPSGCQFLNGVIYRSDDTPASPAPPYCGAVPSPGVPAADPFERIEQLMERADLLERRNAWLEWAVEQQHPTPQLAVDNDAPDLAT
jgi:hypothetical protein